MSLASLCERSFAGAVLATLLSVGALQSASAQDPLARAAASSANLTTARAAFDALPESERQALQDALIWTGFNTMVSPTARSGVRRSTRSPPISRAGGERRAVSLILPNAGNSRPLPNGAGMPRDSPSWTMRGPVPVSASPKPPCRRATPTRVAERVGKARTTR